MTCDPVAFKKGMRHLAASVTLITTRHAGERGGLTATAVCSVSAEPPSLLICVNRKTGTCASIGESGFFNINLLRDPSSELAMRFAGAGGATGEEKFTAGDWDEDTRGLPILKDALVAFCCEVREKVDAGSHAIFIGQIVDIRLGEGVPLLYERSRFHRLTPI